MIIPHADTHSAVVPLDTLSFPLWGSRLIEASAGTGKTYTIASLYVRLVLGHGMRAEQTALTPPDILVTTFTRAATQELRDRIRRRLNEAADCFLGETEGDAFLQALLYEYEPEHWPGCARLLQVAAQWMDDAAVSTIDAWCYRMLREHAFDSASFFDVDMDEDAAATVTEAAQDYWRLYMAPFDANDYARVTAVTGSAEHFAGRLYGNWLKHTGAYPVEQSPAQLLAAKKAGMTACRQQPWSEWLPQMRDILMQAHKDNHLNRRKMNLGNLERWLNQLQDWLDDPDADDVQGQAWLRFTPQGLEAAWNDGQALPQHPGFDALGQLPALDALLEDIWAHAACWVKQRVDDMRRQRAVLDYDGLQAQLAAALQGPNGPRLAQLIRRQFPAALIDEFQDTNPNQYRIFDCVYGVETNDESALLAMIGDPKQAIYRFRGADIHAYLAARRACEGRIYTLDSNYRSSADMVAAVNHVFQVGEQQRAQGAFLFKKPAPDGRASNPVPFTPVSAARDPGDFLVQGVRPKALTLWRDGLPDKRKNEIRIEDIAAACASEVFRLLQLGAQGDAGFRRGDDWQALQARDIAILVNTGTEAKSLKNQLALRGIRSVYLSDKSSVFTTAAAHEVLAWLRACAEPENGAYVRSALATPSLGMSWAELDAFVTDEIRWEIMLGRFAGYKEQWRTQGVLPMLRRYMHEFAVPARLFAEQESSGQEGERHLTDLLHLTELLQAASASLDGEHALIRQLEERIAQGGMAGSDGDVSQIRLESDAGLVQIVTVHKSKGLEYPLVFYPFGYYCREDGLGSMPVSYRDERGKPQVLANKAAADPQLLDTIQADIRHERLAEDLRKLYVALTRARHACWMAVSPYKRSLPHSAMGYLLGGAQACEADALETSMTAMAAGCDAIAVELLPEPLEGRYHSAQQGQEVEPVWRTMSRYIRPSWSLSSYSSLSRFAMEHAPGGVAADDGPAQSLPDEPRRDTFLESYMADETQPESGLEAVQASMGLDEAVAGIHGFPKGAKAGSFLHDLLEWVVTQGPQHVLNHPQELRHHVERRCQTRGWQQHTETIVDWLCDFFTRSFQIGGGEDSSELVLAELQTQIPEMEFWFGIEDADLPALDALVQRYFLAGQPRALISRGRLNGLLRGFIDLAFEHEGRYYVADYKSNWLGAGDSAYDPAALAKAILEHRYDLQAALYLFALHRLLTSRLGAGYDYDEHMGGALIFLIRGARSASQGLYMERPPRELVDQMEALFSRGGRAGQQAQDGEALPCN